MAVISETSPSNRWIRRFFLAVTIGLFLQLPLRNITEPYPAVLLPSGAGVMRTYQGEVTGPESEYLVEDASGENHSFSVDVLFDSVPWNYRPRLVERGFGINHGRDVRRPSFSLLGAQLNLQFGRPLTSDQIEETQVWLRRKLKDALGIEAVRIHILTYAVTTFYNATPIRKERSLSEHTMVELQAGSR